MEIKKLEEPVSVKFEQYECESCKKKMYINQEDKENEFLFCVFCGEKTKNIRVFDIQIKGIGEYNGK